MFLSGFILLALLLAAMVLFWNQNKRLMILEFELRTLQKAFMALRDRLDDTPEAVIPSEKEAETSASDEAEERGEEAQAALSPPETAVLDGVEEPVETEPAAARTKPDAVSEPIPEPAPEPGEKPGIETALGGRWAVWVGGVALALGGIFLVRYTIEAGLLGPKVRLTLAALLGIAAGAGGEFLRRTGMRVAISGINGAYLPGILTAASAFILFGTIYAAHGYYGFIGQASAFVLLCAVSIAAIMLALIHGQAFGGLGLVGSLLTPILVSSNAPNPWALFGFLAIMLAASVFVARIRRWWPMASAAILGTGLWCLAYLSNIDDISVAPVVFIAVVPIVAFTVFWSRSGDEQAPFANEVLIPALATALMAGLEVVGLGLHDVVTEGKLIAIAMIIAAMVAGAAWRPAALPFMIAAGIAAIFWQLWSHLGDFDFNLMLDGVVIKDNPPASPAYLTIVSWLVAGLFIVTGHFQARRIAAHVIRMAASWALFAAIVPLVTITLFWTGYGNINQDIAYTALYLALAVILLVGAETTARHETPQQGGGLAVSVFATGALTSLIFAIHAGFGPGLTTVLCGIAIAVPVAALRLRPWPVWPVLSVAVSAVVIGRIVYDPSIVGEFELGRTVLFNWLLPGYAIPAICAGFSAWQLRKLADGRMRLVQEAFAALFALLTAAILVRHAMNGGEIYSDTVSLAEQAIYTLIAIGGGAVLVALDTRSPSPIFRIGSMIIGGLSMLFIVVSHFGTLNPLLTNESTGTIVFFNLLLLAYFLPAAAMGGLALYARPKRPKPYVVCLGLTAAALAFAYVTLSIRRLHWGEFIGSWKGLTEWETYTYSAAWLVLGVAILIIGIRLKSAALRLASAVLIVIAVAKVFVFDTSQLEGALRALSFIGLGIALIGIGVFYQRLMMANRPDQSVGPAASEAAER